MSRPLLPARHRAGRCRRLAPTEGSRASVRVPPTRQALRATSPASLGRNQVQRGAPDMTDTNRRVLLKSRPQGEPTPANFEVAEAPIPEPKDGEYLSRTVWLSLDPYM